MLRGISSLLARQIHFENNMTSRLQYLERTFHYYGIKGGNYAEISEVQTDENVSSDLDNLNDQFHPIKYSSEHLKEKQNGGSIRSRSFTKRSELSKFFMLNIMQIILNTVKIRNFRWSMYFSWLTKIQYINEIVRSWNSLAYNIITS